MQATTPTAIAHDLTHALTVAGYPTDRTAQILNLLPDAGRVELLQAVNSGSLDDLLDLWIGRLDERLRCSTADAAHVRNLLTGATA